MTYGGKVGSCSGAVDNEEGEGASCFLADVERLIWRAYHIGANSTWVVAQAADRFAYIQLGGVWRPWTFLRNMAGEPPIQYGTEGFRLEIVDDDNPARHYTAFVFMGYFLPHVAAELALWGWEILGFVRYRGKWSWPDIRSGLIGIRHGALLQQYSALIWPALIARDLVERQSGQRPQTEPSP